MRISGAYLLIIDILERREAILQLWTFVIRSIASSCSSRFYNGNKRGIPCVSSCLTDAPPAASGTQNFNVFGTGQQAPPAAKPTGADNFFM